MAWWLTKNVHTRQVQGVGETASETCQELDDTGGDPTSRVSYSSAAGVRRLLEQSTKIGQKYLSTVAVHSTMRFERWLVV